MADFTQAQESAIKSSGSDTLVCAGAGAGKTTVLVERIIQMILDESNPASIDNILVVTFTESATGEMRSRISDAVAKAVKANPDNRYLRNQLSLFNKASIMTIDSFFIFVVRRFFKLADVDIAFKIGDKAEFAIIKDEMLESIINERFEAQDSDFISLADNFCAKPDISPLKQTVLSVCTKLASIPFHKSWLTKSLCQFNITNEDDYFQSDIFKYILDKLIDLEAVMEKRLSEMLAVFSSQGVKMPKFMENLLDFHDELRLCLKKTAYRQLYELLLNYTPSAITGLTSKAIKPYAADIKKYKNEIQELLNDIKDSYFVLPFDVLLDEYKMQYCQMNCLVSVIIEFEDRLMQAKREKSMFDFPDITHMCLEILVDEDGKPTAAAEQLQQIYQEIIIDEYQDINIIQDMIFNAISGRHIGRPNRFMVGDIKQCIYKFRSATPEVFLSKYKSYSKTEGAERRIDLKENFRSRSCIIDCINFLFMQILTETLGEVKYDSEAALAVGASFPASEDNISDCCEYYFIDTADKQSNPDGLSSDELEAHFIAGRIYNMLYREKLQIYDKNINSYRNVQYKDIVILMRSLKTHVDTFSKVFAAYGIPVFARKKTGFFDSIEISLIISYLQLLDNPLQDIPLIAVLHSPIYSLTDDELLLIKSASNENYFFKTLISYDAENNSLKKKLEKFKSDYDILLKISVNSPIYTILQKICSLTDYYAYVGILPNGEQRQANLNVLFEKALTFDASSMTGLISFVKYIDSSKSGDTEGSASIASESENIVRIMTIHASKGLEFPVVFVAKLASNFNTSDLNNKSKVLVHKDLGLAPLLKMPVRLTDSGDVLPPGFYHISQQRQRIIEQMQKEMISEELRILYVALTRAREKLILVSANKIPKVALPTLTACINGEITLNPQMLLPRATNYFNFIYPALSRHKNAADIRIIDAQNDNPYICENNAPWLISRLEPKDITHVELKKQHSMADLLVELDNLDVTSDSSGCKDSIFSSLSWQYPYKQLSTTPTAVSISEIKQNYGQLSEYQDSADSEFKIPQLRKQQIAAASERGLAYHIVMKTIDFNLNSVEKINSHINRLKEKNLLSDQQLDTLHSEKILAFLNTPLCERIREAEKSGGVYRETSFTIGLTPHEVYNSSDTSEALIMVRGIIDLFFEQNNKIVLLDYKTDRQTAGIAEKYKVQLDIYKKLLERNTQKEVTEVLLYLFETNSFVSLT